MNFVSDLIRKTEIRYKYAFLSVFFFGLFSQGMGLFNKYSMHDDVQYFFHRGKVIKWGRWGSYLLIKGESRLFGDGTYSLPVFNGFITIICVGIALCLLIDLLHIRSTVLCVLLGGIAISFPVITSLYGFMYTAHNYGYALLFSVLGPYLILRKNRWYYILLGIWLMAFATGIYQAYIPVILSTFLLTLIRLFHDAECREDRIPLYKKTGIIFLSGIAFVGLYFLLTYASLRYFNETLTGYKSISSMGRLSVGVYLKRVLIAYKEFFNPTPDNVYDVFPGNIRFVNIALMIFAIPFIIKLLYSKRKDPVGAVIILVLLLLVPLAVNFIFVMIKSSDCWALMVYGKYMFFVLFAWLIETVLGDIHTVVARAAKAVCFGGLGLLLLMYCRFDNIVYLQEDLIRAESQRYFSTLVTRIQSVEDYDSWKYVCYIGKPEPGRNDNSVENIQELDHILLPPVHYGLQNALKVSFRHYLKFWCGFTAHEADPAYFKDLPEVKAMPRYPAEGSIKVINDVVVVKFH